MRSYLPIFEEMKKFWRDNIYLDCTSAAPLGRAFIEAGQWPDVIRLPYNFLILGIFPTLAAICSEHENGEVIKFLFVCTCTEEQLYTWKQSGEDFNAHFYFPTRYIGVVRWPGEITVEADKDVAEFTPQQIEISVNLTKKLAVMAIAFLAILSSVKNISIRDQQPSMSRQVRRNLQRTGGLIKHKILAIDLGKKRGCVPLVSVSDERGIPLHWVRGHFATYDIHPLFGKYAGTFWKVPHLRGNKDAGVVLKDYLLEDRC